MMLNKALIAKEKNSSALLDARGHAKSLLRCARRKASGLAVSSRLPVRGKYLMAKPMGFADQCKLSFARPAPGRKSHRASFAPFAVPRG